MATIEEVKKLAALARIKIDEADLPRFTKEFDAILDYVGQLESLTVGKAGGSKPVLRNVFRADGEPHATGAYTKKIVEQFPANEGDALEVKQIISHD